VRVAESDRERALNCVACSVRKARLQHGGALFVTLVMLFMLSIMGITAMRGSTLDHQMATNSVQARDVFQAAESSNEIVLNKRNNLTAASQSASGKIYVETEIRPDIGMSSAVTLRFVGTGNAPGASLNAAQGANSFDAYRYVAEGVASVESIRTSRQIDQGAYVTAPSVNVR